MSQSIRTFNDALDFLYQFINYEHKTTIKYIETNYNLHQFKEFLQQIGSPQKGLQYIHVAGSKGKGSTSAILASLLSAHGYRTGIYSSPHLINIRERFRIDGHAISNQDFIELVRVLTDYVERTQQKSSKGFRTTFELMTALCFLYFQRERPDWSIMEVGMGGRLDCTNVIQPNLCLVTPICLDHVESLGHSLEEIAYEKAGIFKQGVPILVGNQKSRVWRVLRRKARHVDSMIIPVNDLVRLRSAYINPQGSIFSVAFDDSGWDDLKIKLCGRMQVENTCLALAALKYLERNGLVKIDEKRLRKGLNGIRWYGRMDIRESPSWFPGKPPGYLIIDGAHNGSAVKRMIRDMKELFPGEKPLVIFAAPSNKDVKQMLSALGCFAETIIVTRYSNPRSMKIHQLATMAAEYCSDVLKANTLKHALFMASNVLNRSRLLMVTGSLYLAGELYDIAGEAEGTFV